MERTEVSKKVIEYIDGYFGFAPNMSVGEKEATKFKEELGGDSLDLVNVIMEIEKEFGITITDEETYRLEEGETTIGQIIDLTMEKIQAKNK